MCERKYKGLLILQHVYVVGLWFIYTRNKKKCCSIRIL